MLVRLREETGLRGELDPEVAERLRRAAAWAADHLRRRAAVNVVLPYLANDGRQVYHLDVMIRREDVGGTYGRGR